MNNNQELSKIHIYLRKSKLFYIPRKCYAILLGIRKHGIKAQMKWVHGRISDKIAQKNYYKCLQITPQERQRQKEQQYETATRFSILVPLYNTPEKFLREMIESVQNQTYGDWELCLADGSDQEHTEVGNVVKEYQQNDQRIRYQQLEKNGGISENTNACLAMASGDYVVLFDHDDLLHECALYELKKAVDEQGADFIYTDEAVFSKDFHKPDSYHFKPDFAPDRASMLTLIAALAVSKAISEKTGQEAEIKWPNDIVMNGKKVCGILTEMSAQLDYINHVVIGIGINVQNESFPKEIEQVATSILMETGQHVNRAELIEAVLEQFERYYEIFLETEDLSGLVKEYNAHLINMQKQVRVLDPKEPYEAKAMGITPHGELIVDTWEGRKLVSSGEVSVRGVYGYV